MEEIGKIAHFFSNINVAVVELNGELKLGDKIKIRRKNGEEFVQEVKSMQIAHNSIEEAGPEDSVGMKMDKPVGQGDIVFRV